MKNSYAFCIIHFGNKKVYLEYEIYTILMLRENSKYDIVYLYSINDTPQEFVDIIKQLNVITKPYDDKNITFEINNFKSIYKHFNTLRTCNYLFALNLIEYTKICIIESDLVIMKNIDNIFDLECPAILYYKDTKTRENNKVPQSDKEELLTKSSTQSFVNGGVILCKPSIKYYKKSIKNIKKIIEKNCEYPNESLFIYSMKNIYNLPIMYNLSHYLLKQYLDIKDNVSIYHFNSTIYKPLDIIKDNYIEKDKNKLRKHIVLLFKEKYYDKYNKYVQKLLNI
jgi:hypothetical protein